LAVDGELARSVGMNNEGFLMIRIKNFIGIDEWKMRRISRMLLILLICGMWLGCSGGAQVYTKGSHRAITLEAGDLEAHGLAFITPSTVTGQEEEKQAVAFSFAEVLKKTLPHVRCVTLPETLSAVNMAGYADEYRKMYNDYRDTGIFKREILLKVADVTGTKYIGQLKLQGFRQGSFGRFGLFGLRIMETKYATLRLFFPDLECRKGFDFMGRGSGVELFHRSGRRKDGDASDRYRKSG